MAEKVTVSAGAAIGAAPAIIAASKILTEIVDYRIRQGTSWFFEKPPSADLLEGVIQAVLVTVALPLVLYAGSIGRFFARLGRLFLKRWLTAHNIPVEEVLDPTEINRPSPKE